MNNFRFGCDLADAMHRIDERKNERNNERCNERRNHWLL
jgi:hypothetical protein